MPRLAVLRPRVVETAARASAGLRNIRRSSRTGTRIEGSSQRGFRRSAQFDLCRSRTSAPHVLTFVALSILGLTVRLWRLGEQVLGGDELHVFSALRATTLTSSWFTFRPADASLPLTAWSHLADRTGYLTDAVLRAPQLAFGFLLLVIGAALLHRLLGAEIAAAWLALAAISPSLVLFSRLVRPYSLATTTAFLACFSAWQIWRQPNVRSTGAAMGVLGAFTIWCHPAAAPASIAPILWLGLTLLRAEPGTRRRLLPAFALGCSTFLCGLALFLLPGWESFQSSVLSKGGGRPLDPNRLIEAAQLLAGTSSFWMALAWWATVVVGLVLLWRHNSRFASLLLTVVATQLSAVVLVKPDGAADPLVFRRYLVFVLPCLLVFAAFAIASLAAGFARRSQWRWVRPLGPIGVVVIFFAAGPLAKGASLWSSFLHHNDYLRFTRPIQAGAEVTHLYEIAAHSRGPLIELPWFPEWRLSRVAVIGEAIHRGSTYVVPLNRRHALAAIGSARLLPPDPEAILNSGARYLLVHLDLASEEAAVARGTYPPLGGAGRERFRIESEEINQDVARLVATFHSQWGPPAAFDSSALLWDLALVRARIPLPEASPEP